MESALTTMTIATMKNMNDFHYIKEAITCATKLMSAKVEGEHCMVILYAKRHLLGSNLSSQNDLQTSPDDQILTTIFSTSMICDQPQ